MQRHKTNQSEVKIFEPKKSLLTLRRTAKLILRKASQQSESDKTIILLLKQQHPQLNTAIELIQKFADLVRNHQPEELEEWYEKASSCEIKALKSFARGIKEDWEAVKNGMTYQWSNGQVEGQVNRLKMLKRHDERVPLRLTPTRGRSSNVRSRQSRAS